MEGPYNLIWLVIGLPLVGFLFQALFGKSIVAKMGDAKGKRLMGAAAVAPIALAFLVGLFLTLQLAGRPADQRSVVTTLFDWITLANIRIPFEALVDPLSMTMVLIITGIGALIHLYATGYMSEERDYTRFFTYLNLFIAFMLVLVLANNLVLLFVGWEGVGLCSYLLIGFWYKDLANARAANKAFIVNRIGDWGLTLGMFMLFAMLAGHYDELIVADNRLLSYDVILPNAVRILQGDPIIATAIALLLFVGAMGKSAQFPLYLWLPDAMAGPTPVSALIHAATMVTAGVFMLNRLHVLFELSPWASAFIAVTGAFTAAFAALIAFGQTDIKKVLAYSTVSQLGFMFIACGAGAYWAGMFHVTTHAFFKALLFLGSGAVIHAMAHNQDMRNYGNLRKYLPITSATMIIGWLAIAGIPPLAGFWSKEAILGSAMANAHAYAAGVNFGYYSGWIGLIVAALTAAYMTRMTWLTFFGTEERWRAIPAHAHAHGEHEDEEHGHGGHHDQVGHDHGPDEHGFFYTDEEMASRHEPHDHHHELDKNHKPHEVPPSMWVPLAVLAVLSVLGGLVLNMNHLLEHWLYPNGLTYLGEISTHPEGVPLLALSIGAAVLGIAAAAVYYLRGLPKSEGWDESKWSRFRLSARDQFGYDKAMVDTTVVGGGDLGLALWRWFDAKIIDGAVNGVASVTGGFGVVLRKLQTGYARFYALMMLAGGVALLAYFAVVISRLGGNG